MILKLEDEVRLRSIDFHRPFARTKRFIERHVPMAGGTTGQQPQPFNRWFAFRSHRLSSSGGAIEPVDSVFRKAGPRSDQLESNHRPRRSERPNDPGHSRALDPW